MSKATVKQFAPFLVLVAVTIGALFVPSFPNFDDGGKYSAADIAWILVATALVFLMSLGLAFVYGRGSSQHNEKYGYMPQHA